MPCGLKTQLTKGLLLTGCPWVAVLSADQCPVWLDRVSWTIYPRPTAPGKATVGGPVLGLAVCAAFGVPLCLSVCLSQHLV